MPRLIVRFKTNPNAMIMQFSSVTSAEQAMERIALCKRTKQDWSNSNYWVDPAEVVGIEIVKD